MSPTNDIQLVDYSLRRRNTTVQIGQRWVIARMTVVSDGVSRLLQYPSGNMVYCDFVLAVYLLFDVRLKSISHCEMVFPSEVHE
jgi:hypothetical protein